MATAVVDIRPARADYKITRGDDFADTILIKEGDPAVPVDVSARIYTAQVRTTPDSTTVVAQMAIGMSAADDGIVGISIADTITADMDASDDGPGEYVWDLQQNTGGVIRTLVGGTFKVYADVTRSA